MITFAQFSERLARGQLKNTAAVDDTNLGEICPEYEDTILSLTNQGLVDLSTRFPLITKQVDLTFVEGQHVYQLVQSNVGIFLDSTPTYLRTTSFKSWTFGIHTASATHMIPMGIS